jgi:arsenate reductase (glutaredoxin)
MVVYGIRNCNTVKSALEWLRKHNIEFEFHDYKGKGISGIKLREWTKQVRWESLVNKRGTTWRQLDAETQAKVTNQASAIALMIERTSVIKRPLIEVNNKIVVLGFDEADYASRFSRAGINKD